MVYARVSTLDQAAEEKVSIFDQVKWAKDICEQRGWAFVEPYIEPGVFGDIEFEDRPAAASLLEDVKPLNSLLRKFDIVLVYHSSRLAREADLILRFHRRLAQTANIQVYMRNVAVEPITPTDYYWGGNYVQQMTAALAGVQDQQENVTRGERVRSGFRGLAERGKMVFAPFWLKKVPKIETLADGKQVYDWHFELIPSKAVVAKRIVDEYLSSGSFRKIAFSLVGDKIPSPTGKLGPGSWSSATIKNILTNPALVGKVRWGRKLGSKYKQGKTVSGKQKRVFTAPDRWVQQEAKNVPSIIDEATFNKIQDRVKSRSKVTGRQLASDSLLAGKIWCGDCQKRAYLKTRRAKKPNGQVYVRSDFIDSSYVRGNTCRRHLLAAPKLEHLVLTKLKTRLKELRQEDVSNELSLEEAQSTGSLTAHFKVAQKHLQEYDSKVDRLVELFEDGGIIRDVFDRRYEVQKNERALLEQEVEKIQFLINDQVKRKDVLSTLRQLLEMFEAATEPMVRKEMVGRIIDKVFIFRGRVEIVYKYDSGASVGLYVKPHPCGFFGDTTKECTCLPGQVTRYQKRISGPILDRIDLHISVPAVKTKDLLDIPAGESSAQIRKRVQLARNEQEKRFKSTGIVSNAEMTARQVKEFCRLEPECRELISAAINKMNLSARSFYRILKVSRTIADLDAKEKITPSHLAEALQYKVELN
ncbi:MAG: recombinase family protein [bacterium]|nr:recombinase family protein [bacterium]